MRADNSSLSSLFFPRGGGRKKKKNSVRRLFLAPPSELNGTVSPARPSYYHYSLFTNRGSDLDGRKSNGAFVNPFLLFVSFQLEKRERMEFTVEQCTPGSAANFSVRSSRAVLPLWLSRLLHVDSYVKITKGRL